MSERRPKPGEWPWEWTYKELPAERWLSLKKGLRVRASAIDAYLLSEDKGSPVTKLWLRGQDVPFPIAGDCVAEIDRLLGLRDEEH
jgi:hypothetical protein